MGLRCLLGHDFDEPETERERTEEGNEVVVTVREVKTCSRCGEKQVVSENKEITSIEQLRETATGEPATDADPEPTETTLDDGWSTDDAATRSDVADPAPGAADPDLDAGGDQEETGPAAAESNENPVDRGVADIIEQAEKDDEMLDQPAADAAEGGAEEDAEDDIPVHPGERAAAAEESADEGPDPERDDGVILDEEEASRPEDARHQWEEEASPEEVPGQDLSVSEPEPPTDDDAEIIDGESEPQPTEPADEPAPRAPADEPEPSTDTLEAVDGEDAEIMDAGPESPARSDPEPEPSTDREEAEEGHTPWPEPPGEDEGHDAAAPDGEPADVDFGGGLTPTDADREEAASETDSAPEPEPTREPADPEPAEPTASERANGHQTEEGEPSDASTSPTANVNLERTTRDASMEYRCPECGLTREVGNSSMRAGDICPECHKGYITEQQKAE
ncbi:MAG: DUF7093 family protein [Halolamina sp.]